MTHLIKRLSGRSKSGISKAEALSVARQECEKRRWGWREPVIARSRRGIWVVHTNWGSRGMNATIYIDGETGDVIDATYLPR